MYKTGIVSAVDENTCRARVKFPQEGGLESYWLQVLQRNTWSNKDNGLPDVDEPVAVLLDERGESGCILGAYYDDTNKPPNPSKDVRRITYSDGTVIEYDRSTHKLKATVAGEVELTAEKLTATVSGVAKIDCPNTEVTGALKVAAGSDKPALDSKVSGALTTLKNAISSAVPGASDGGAALKTAIVGALSAWPPDLGSAKVTCD